MNGLDELAGGVAVVTGAGSGIGEGIARAAARAGMKVVLADIVADRVRAVADSIVQGGGSALAVQTDVSDVESVDHLAAITRETFGDVRLLVNNAGIELFGYVWEIPPTQWKKVIDVNILGVINGVRAFAPAMITAQKPTFISNVASVGGLNIMPLMTPYIMTKHAVLAYTECLALEMGLVDAPISISAVLPGPVKTGIFGDAPASTRGERADIFRANMQAMLGEFGMTSEDAGDLILSGIASRNFWISTHPELMAESADERAAILQSRVAPSLNDQNRVLLGLA